MIASCAGATHSGAWTATGAESAGVDTPLKSSVMDRNRTLNRRDIDSTRSRLVSNHHCVPHGARGQGTRRLTKEYIQIFVRYNLTLGMVSRENKIRGIFLIMGLVLHTATEYLTELPDRVRHGLLRPQDNCLYSILIRPNDQHPRRAMCRLRVLSPARIYYQQKDAG